MSRVAVIAAGGRSSRTGLGAYTTKAALFLQGKTLLQHQLDFCRRSGVERAVVICRPRHARLLGDLLPPEERKRVAWVMLPEEGVAGWAGTVEWAASHFAPEDEVVLLPCDNYQMAERIERLRSGEDSLHTYTRVESASTNGPVFGRVTPNEEWRSRPAEGFSGDAFTGYAVARGAILREVLPAVVPSDRGEKEMTGLLDRLFRACRHRAVHYPGDYLDVSDVSAFARIAARLRGDDPSGSADVGAGAVFLDTTGEFALLTERADGRGWVPPGGLPQSGESWEDAARRETREESGYEADGPLRLLGVYPSRGKDGRPAASVMFWGRVGGRVRDSDRAEVQDVGWFTRDGLKAIEIPFDLRVAVEDALSGREIDCRGRGGPV